MLCHRYGNPAFFIECALSCGRFAASIDDMREAVEEERLWDIYLRGDMQQSFNDWRADLTRKAKAQKGMTGAELVAARQKAIDIFKRCKPPEE